MVPFIFVLGDKIFLVVDTNSKDRTREIARAKGAKVIDEPRRGYGRAYKTGFEKAQGEIIATLDADCTYPAEDIPGLVKALDSENLDFITCDRLSKLEKGVMLAKHWLGNWILKVTTNILFSMRIKDSLVLDIGHQADGCRSDPVTADRYDRFVVTNFQWNNR